MASGGLGGVKGEDIGAMLNRAKVLDEGSDGGAGHRRLEDSRTDMEHRHLVG